MVELLHDVRRRFVIATLRIYQARKGVIAEEVYIEQARVKMPRLELSAVVRIEPQRDLAFP